ncbi:MAG: zinc-ribbon domain-containing protein, partial [Ruminococcus sp.]|nr:zinc-ribbon domain-containing protein [Ruminococcus sp.]
MICKNCGNENDDSDLFCRNCGKKLEKDSRPKINLSKDIVSSGKKTENSVADTTTGENRPKINLLKKSISKNEKTENNVADTHTEENKRTNIILHNSVSDTVSADNSFGDNQSENNKTDIHRNGIIKPVQQNIPVDNTVTNNTVYADNNLTNNNYVQEESVFCRYCGKKLDKTDRFCDRCGKSVFEQPLSPDYTQNPMPYGVPPQSVKHKKRTVVVVVVSLIVMVVMCFVVRAVYEEIQVKKAADEMLSMMENSSYDENSKPKSAVTTVKAEKTNAVATEQHTTVKKSSDAISSTKTTTAKKAPSISGSITKQKSTGDGYDIYINVSGSYDYYEYEYYEASPDGNVNLTDSGTENKSSFRVSGFSAGVPYVYADIIPYNDDGTSGSKITVRLDIDTNTETKQPAKKNATISSCNKLGLINCHGGTVAGYTTSYVA